MTSSRGKNPLGPSCFRLAVFCHQRFAKPLLDLPVVDDPYPAEQTYASIGETRIAFEPAVIKDAFLLIDLEANARLPLDVCAQMSAALVVCKYTSPSIQRYSSGMQ